MDNESRLSLRERAYLFWQRERPKREAARLEWQAKKLDRVRQKLAQIIGPEHSIEIGINSKGDIIASVEDIHFVTYNYDDDLLHIVPIISCPLCGKEVSLGFINDLAELGEKLDLLESSYRHICDFRGAELRA